MISRARAWAYVCQGEAGLLREPPWWGWHGRIRGAGVFSAYPGVFALVL